MSVYANLNVEEGNVSGEVTLTFSFKARQIVITNDSGANDMTFKFNVSETGVTLKPTETITLEINSKTVILSSTNADYRVWGMG